MSYVIACSNIKGGTAKTSSVTSLAGILAQQQYRVLVIDCDPQSNLTIALGINPEKLDRGDIQRRDVLFRGYRSYYRRL